MKKLLALLLSTILSVPLFAAQSSISVPAQGDGLGLNARTGSFTDKRQVFVVGDSTNTAVAPVDDSSGLSVNLHGNPQATYSATMTNVAASTGTWCSLYGSATKIVKITSIKFNGMAATALASNVTINKRSAATSGGTPGPSTLTNVPHSSNFAAASAVAKSYTINPTVGANVGVVDSYNVILGTTVATNFYGRDFTNQPVVLNAAAEGVTVDCDGTVYSSSKINCSFTWTEE